MLCIYFRIKFIAFSSREKLAFMLNGNSNLHQKQVKNMVQIIPANPRRSSSAEIAGKALGGSLNIGLQVYQHHQNQKKKEEEYQEENSLYSKLTGRNLSKNPKTREMEVEYALRGDLEANKENAKFKTKREEEVRKLIGEKRTQNELLNFADKINERYPNSPLHNTVADLYRTDLPLEEKTKLVNSLIGIDPFKRDQQERLRMDSVLRRYNSRIKELQDSIKNARYNERAPLQQQLKDLQDERDDPLDFKALNGYENESEEAEEDTSEDEEPKVKFNPSNKQHRSKAEALFRKLKDKEKVRKALSREFGGL
jgi:hypothetical protein